MKYEFNYDANFTDNERKIMELVFNGYSHDKLRYILGIKSNTLKSNLRKIYRKIGVDRGNLILIFLYVKEMKKRGKW